ncbi:uncharacterized protein A1O9_12009, partial [Exophiala aquamarina CBS 119918]
GGLTYAIRFLLAANLQPLEILFVDNETGFGGACYLNRYPGLMCDLESSYCMPLLEETGYIPKDRYEYGSELGNYTEYLAARWVLQIQKISQHGTIITLDIRTEFFVLTSGLLHNPKLPNVTGIDKFNKHTFHTALWDYAYT